MNLTLVTPPAKEPVDFSEQQLHSRIDTNADVNLIKGYIKAAREHAETFTNRAFITQSWKATIDCFPSEIKISKPPHQSLTDIQYVDTEGQTQTLDSSLYQVDLGGEDMRIKPVKGEVFPSIKEQMNAVTVNFVCGYGDKEDVPEAIKTAIKLIASELYERRETAIVGMGGIHIQPVVMSAEMLLWPYRVLRF